jgi:hypothetical protein
MKIITTILFLLLTSCIDGKAIYIGSTPANNSIKTFLGIPLTESVDFIRWKLVTHGEQYFLHTDYGISKPNTNGFIDPKTIDIKGKVTKEGNYYRLNNNNKMMLLAIFNGHVLHFANADKRFMKGTDGWSYGLYSSGNALPSDIKPKQIAMNDSMVFHGRTPCTEIAKLGLKLSPNCYKIKWLLVLYTANGKPSTYRTRGNIMPAKGTWKRKNGMIILEAPHPVYFISPDENILLFTDAKWNLLQGDLDFGYALNRE